MGQVKQAVLEVEDFVSACVRDGRTLNQTIRDARESIYAKHNPYLDDEDMVENKYYQFKGAWLWISESQ
jgi:serine/threonine protein kinase HipA of HipAB toxin-antitoxin module